MNFHFLISFPAKNNLTLLQAQKKLKKILENSKIEILEGFVAPAKKDFLDVEVENYSQKLTKLQSAVELVAHDSSQIISYGNFARRQKKSAKNIENISEKAAQILRIKKFLFDLPDDPKFEKLVFLQDLLKRNLSLEKALKNPEFVDVVAIQAFENFHAEYVRVYFDFFKKRDFVINKWLKKIKKIEQKIFVIASLDQIAALGSPSAPQIEAEFELLKKEFRATSLTDIQIKKMLHVSPLVDGVTFFSRNPVEVFDKFEDKIENAFREKIERLKESSVLQILSSSQETTVKKFIRLISLSDFEKIAGVFTPKTAPKIIREFSQIFDNVKINMIFLGDFSASKKELSSSADIDSVSREFNSFLSEKFKKNKRAKLRLE